MQDSLGGNSKTTIIANVSPSIWSVLKNKFAPHGYFVGFVLLFCLIFLLITLQHICSSANETLSTLKFAQRAKLIQNNVQPFNSFFFFSQYMILATFVA